MCVSHLRREGLKGPLVSAFTQPDLYPEFINAVFEEWIRRKLLGLLP